MTRTALETLNNKLYGLHDAVLISLRYHDASLSNSEVEKVEMDFGFRDGRRICVHIRSIKDMIIQEIVFRLNIVGRVKAYTLGEFGRDALRAKLGHQSYFVDGNSASDEDYLLIMEQGDGLNFIAITAPGGISVI